MSEMAIHVRGVSKRYKIGVALRYKALRDVLADKPRAPVRMLTGRRRPASTFFWALDDGSFDVKRGEVLGRMISGGGGDAVLWLVGRDGS